MPSPVGRTTATIWPHELETLNSLKMLLREKLHRSNLTLGQAITEADKIVRETLARENETASAP